MIDIVYSDKDICVCRKPRGVLSEGEGQGTLPSLLSEALGKMVYPVHRLDKGTEGLMVFALSSAAAAALSRQITDGAFKKEYVARLCGVPKEEIGRLTDLLFYDRARGKTFVVKRARKGVKEAVLDYRVTSVEGGQATVRVRLITGRTHQIRAQFASRGMPLCGDRRYGAPADSGEFSLCSCYLSFVHPTSGEALEFGDIENKMD